MEAPVEPNKEDCCSSGCNPCIFDVYEKQLKKYQKYLENGEKSNIDENGISQLEYTKFIVIDIEVICKSHYVLMFKRNETNDKKIWWKPGEHFLFKYISATISCTRAYTPIPIENKHKENCFSIIVKQYEGGVVSTHLCNLKKGDITVWRGPYGHYEIIPNKFNRIIMFAQGTGIAPFLSIIDNILNNEEDMTKLMLLYCCKCDDSILFRDELFSYQSYWNFNYLIFVSTTFSNLVLKYQEPIKLGKLCVQDLNNLKPFVNSDQFLVCGSSQFNTFYDSYLKQECGIKENIVLF